MAKKKTKSTGRAKPAAKRSAGKKRTGTAVLKKKAAAKPKKKSGGKPAAAPSGTFTVSTGKGPSASEIGASLVALYNEGKGEEPSRLWFAPGIVSVEGSGMAWRGREAVKAKGEGWYRENTVLGGSAEGPYVGASGFSVKFRIEVVEKATGMRTRMEEVGVYTVQDGKVVREEYMYGPMQQQREPVAGV